MFLLLPLISLTAVFAGTDVESSQNDGDGMDGNSSDVDASACDDGSGRAGSSVFPRSIAVGSGARSVGINNTTCSEALVGNVGNKDKSKRKRGEPAAVVPRKSDRVRMPKKID